MFRRPLRVTKLVVNSLLSSDRKSSRRAMKFRFEMSKSGSWYAKSKSSYLEWTIFEIIKQKICFWAILPSLLHEPSGLCFHVVGQKGVHVCLPWVVFCRWIHNRFSQGHSHCLKKTVENVVDLKITQLIRLRLKEWWYFLQEQSGADPQMVDLEAFRHSSGTFWFWPKESAGQTDGRMALLELGCKISFLKRGAFSINFFG